MACLAPSSCHHRGDVRVRTLLIAAAVTLGLSACTEGLEEAADVLESPSAPPTLAASGTPSMAPTDAIGRGGKAIAVSAPERGVEVLSPVVIAGVAESASGEVLVQILDAQSTELAAMNAEVGCGAGCRGEYRVELAFFVQSRQEGTVRVSEAGAKGDAEHLVDVPVTLVPGV